MFALRPHARACPFLLFIAQKVKFTKTAEKVKFTKTAKSEVYKNLRKFLEIYKSYKTEVYKNHPKNEVYKNRIFFEIYKFTRVNFTKTMLPHFSRCYTDVSESLFQ